MEQFKIAIGQPNELEQQVNDLLEQGWQLHGYTTLYTPVNSSHQILIQPMRYQDD